MGLVHNRGRGGLFNRGTNKTVISTWTPQLPPTGIVLTTLSDTSIKVDWTDPVSADGVKIYFDGVLKDTVAFGVGTSTVTGLTENTSYSVSIKSYTGATESTAVTGTKSTWAEEYKSVYDAFVSKPSIANQVNQDTLVKALLPVWSKAAFINIYAVHGKAESLFNWKNPAANNPAYYVGEPTWSENKGWAGIIASARNIQTNYTPSTDGAGFLGQDDICMIVGVNEEKTEGKVDCAGEGTANNHLRIYSRFTTDILYCTCNSQTNIEVSSLKSKRHFAVSRNTGANFDVYRNLVKVNVTAVSTALCDGEVFGAGKKDAANSKNISYLMLFKYLTESEVRSVMEACESYLTNYNYQLMTYQRNVYVNMVLEGHSFLSSVNNKGSDAQIKDVNVKDYYNSAVAGSLISGCSTRAATVDGKLIEETATYKNWLVLWIGVNEVNETAGTGTTAYNNLKTYVQNRITAGWKVAVYTMTPSTSGGRGAQFEIERDTFNGLLRSDLATINGAYILDTDTKAELLNPADTTYFNADALHLVAGGHIVASTLLYDLIESIY